MKGTTAMFTQLKDLLTPGNSLIITASGLPGGQIHLTLSTKAANSDTPSKLPPLIVTGTAEELDAELPVALTQFSLGRVTASEAVTELEKQYDAVKKENETKLTQEKGKSSKGAAATKPAAPAPAPKPAPEATTSKPALF